MGAAVGVLIVAGVIAFFTAVNLRAGPRPARNNANPRGSSIPRPGSGFRPLLARIITAVIMAALAAVITAAATWAAVTRAAVASAARAAAVTTAEPLTGSASCST